MVCCISWVAFVACPPFDQDELFYWGGMREAVGVDPSEASFTLQEVGVFGFAFP